MAPKKNPNAGKMGDNEEPQSEFTMIMASLNQLHNKFDKMHDTIYDAETGLKPEVELLKCESSSAVNRLTKLEADNQTLRKELDIVKGLLQREYFYRENLEKKVLDLTARSMSNNVTISGLQYNRGENCKEKVINFFERVMEIPCNPAHVIVAHRIGIVDEKSRFAPLMIARVETELKETIFGNVANLRNKKNADGHYYYVNTQLPEAIQEEKRNIRSKVKELNEINNSLPDDRKIKVAVRNNRLYIDGDLYSEPVEVPQPKDLFPTPEEQKKMSDLKVLKTDYISDQGSKFWGVAIKVTSINEVRRAYRRVKQDHPEMDKIMMGYITKDRGNIVMGSQDDHEYSGGSKILQVMRNMKVQGVAIFVVRRYGGKHLGRKRYLHIEDSAKAAIQLYNNK